MGKSRQAFRLLQAIDVNGRTVSAREIGLEPEPFTRPLHCPHCPHEVHTTRAYPKHSPKGRAFTVSAHFYLAKEKDGTPAEHDPSCPLRASHSITTIARRSHGLAELRGGGLLLRLVLPKTTDPSAPAAPLPGAAVTPPPDNPLQHRIRSVEPVLPPALTSAARIAQLLALYGHDPDTVECFTVKHEGLRTPVAWSQFCFGPGPADLGRLYQVLRTAAARYPVAVHGQVIAQGVSSQGIHWRRIATAVPTGESNGRPDAEVYLRSEHPVLFAPLTVGTHVLALGAPDAPWGTWTPSKASLGPQMVLWPRAHWQIAYWSVDDTGLPSAPASPAPIPAPAPPRRQRTAAVKRPSPAKALAPRRAGTQPKVQVPGPQPQPLGGAFTDTPELAGQTIPPMPTHPPVFPAPDSE